MVTRERSGILKPKVYTANLDIEEPCNFQQAMQSEKWKAAMNDEYNALM